MMRFIRGTVNLTKNIKKDTKEAASIERRSAKTYFCCPRDYKRMN